MAETDVVFTSGEAKRSRTGSDQKSRGQIFENILSSGSGSPGPGLQKAQKGHYNVKYIRRRLLVKIHTVSIFHKGHHEIEARGL